MKKPAILLSIALLVAPLLSIYAAVEEEPGEAAPAPLLAPAKNVSYPARGIILLISPNLSQVYNSDIFGDDNWDASGKLGFNFELGYFFKLNRVVSLGAGIGYSNFKSELTQDSISYQRDYIDHDQHNVTEYVRINPISESLNVSCLDIPLYVEFGNPNVDQIGFYGRIGLKMSFPISHKLTGDGSYSSWGHYPDCPVTLYDIPELGYYTDKPIYDEMEEPELKSVVFSALFSAGVSFPLSDALVLKAGANINLGLSELSEYKAGSDEDFEDYGNYSKLLNNPEKTSLKSYGIEIGLIYSLRNY